MPWSAKAQELLERQYAAVGAAGQASLAAAAGAVERALGRMTGDVRRAADGLAGDLRGRHECLKRYIDAYRRYCWPVRSLDDLKLAPFHLLATEGKVHVDRDHAWHMASLAKICAPDTGFLLATPFKIFDLLDPASEADGIQWWLDLTAAGG